MRASEFRRLAVAHFGATGWRTKVANALEVDRATIYRWEKGRQPVPRSVLLALEGLEHARMHCVLKADLARKRKAL